MQNFLSSIHFAGLCVVIFLLYGWLTGWPIWLFWMAGACAAAYGCGLILAWAKNELDNR
jgi:hypothetical protein